MNKKIKDIIENEMDCLITDVDFIIKKEGSLQSLVNMLEASINNTNFCKGLRGESKSFFNLKTIDDIKRLYPNQESYGVSVSKGLLRFYVNDNLIHTKAVNYIEECTEVTPEMYKHIKTRKK